MMLTYSHIASRIFARPLLITPTKLDVILWALRDRLDLDMAAPEMRPQWRAFRPPAEARFDDEGGYRVLDGVAIIPLFGTLVGKTAGLDAMSGLTSYERITERLEHALGNPAVRRILLNLDTPGGEANELFDLVDFVAESRQRKPITAMVADEANSAGYAIASATHEIVVTQTGSVGSIGVVMTHRSEAPANEKRGVVYTHIYAGEHKVDGSPFIPLGEDARAEFESDVQKLYGMLTQSVARNLGLSEQAVIDTQARIYLGQDGVDVGLAHRVSSARDELARQRAQSLAAARSRISLSAYRLRSKTMTEPVIIETTQPELDQQLAAARTEGEAAGRQAGAAAERERIAAILDHEQAAGRQALARHLALHTAVSVEEAAATLTASPVESAPKPNRLDQAMQRIPQPRIPAEDLDTAAAKTEPKKFLNDAFERRQQR